eukprot:3608755-Prymnesium_polylepis.2
MRLSFSPERSVLMRHRVLPPKHPWKPILHSALLAFCRRPASACYPVLVFVFHELMAALPDARYSILSSSESKASLWSFARVPCPSTVPSA